MDHPFIVGETYQNRDGLYEVVRINEDAGKMVVRFLDSGEEVENSIKIQARIWQNLSWDNEEARKRKKLVEEQYQKNYGLDFTGLVDSDFKTNIEGTTWRSRKGLAGMVARLLSPGTDYTFVSWAIYPWPVSFLTHRENYNMAAFEMGAKKAKFTIELDDLNAYYGLYVEKNGGEMDDTWDWTRFSSRLLQDKSLQEIITDAENQYGVRFLGRALDNVETSHFADGLQNGAQSLWNEQNPSRFSVIERLKRTNGIPLNYWGEIYLIATISKRQAVDAGIEMAHQMAKVMKLLLPLYTAATYP